MPSEVDLILRDGVKATVSLSVRLHETEDPARVAVLENAIGGALTGTLSDANRYIVGCKVIEARTTAFVSDSTRAGIMSKQSMADEFKSHSELELDEAEQKIVAEAVRRGAGRQIQKGRKPPRESTVKHLEAAKNWARYLKRVSTLYKAVIAGEIDLQYVADDVMPSNPDDLIFLKRSE